MGSVRESQTRGVMWSGLMILSHPFQPVCRFNRQEQELLRWGCGELKGFHLVRTQGSMETSFLCDLKFRELLGHMLRLALFSSVAGGALW